MDTAEVGVDYQGFNILGVLLLEEDLAGLVGRPDEEVGLVAVAEREHGGGHGQKGRLDFALQKSDGVVVLDEKGTSRLKI